MYVYFPCCFRMDDGFFLEYPLFPKYTNKEELPQHRHTFLNLIKSCNTKKDLIRARHVHSLVLGKGLFCDDLWVSNALLSMYAKCGSIKDSVLIFDKLPCLNHVSWNSMITGYVQNRLDHEALKCFKQMQDAGFVPDSISFLYILKACGNIGSLEIGEEIYGKVSKEGLLEKDFKLGTAMMDMYARCNMLEKAQKVFDNLVVRDIVSWTTLISGYIQNGLIDEAMLYLQKMQDDGFYPGVATFISILKACGSIECLHIGEQIHDEIRKNGLLEKNSVLGTTLVNMYVKCNMLERAQDVFDSLCKRDVVSWSALIAGYAQHGYGEKALNCFSLMQEDGVSPDVVTFIVILKACGSIKSLEVGEEIHVKVRKEGLLEENVMLGNALVDMYVKCGAMGKAQKLFDELRVRNVVCWNSLIGGYVQYGLGDEALKCFNRMQGEGLSPDAITFVCALKACGLIRSIEMGEEIRAEISKQKLLEKNINTGNALLGMYVKCGVLEKAQELFDELPIRDTISWNLLISGYSHHGLANEALFCFKKMQDQGICPDIGTFISMCKVCGVIGSLKMLEEIHTQVSKKGFMKKHPILGSELVHMYSKFSMMGKAREVFNKLLVRDVVTWNALITGYTKNGLDNEALDCFKLMQDEGISPNGLSFSCILKACSNMKCFEMGEEIYEEVIKQGLLRNDPVLGTALVNMYANFGMMEKAQEVFDKFPVRDAASWTALISGYAYHGLSNKAIDCFRHMRDDGIFPDSVTFICMLKVCTGIRSLRMGEEVHAEIIKQDLLEEHITLGNTLVDMYAKLGMLEIAQEVLHKLTNRNVVTWNALIAGYVEHGLMDKALECFLEMRAEGFLPDAVTFICIFKACGSIGSLEMGDDACSDVRIQGLLQEDIVLCNALIYMYAKCGVLRKAHEMFSKIPIQNVVSWNALIAGYAQLGEFKIVFELFNKMMVGGVLPDVVTYLVLMSVCCHVGLIDEGQKVFDHMTTYNLSPNLEHYTCMVDLFGRAGDFNKAMHIIEKVPYSDCLPLFLVLLGACHKWANVELGRWAFEQSVMLEKNCASAYVAIGNINAAAGLHVGADFTTMELEHG